MTGAGTVLVVIVVCVAVISGRSSVKSSGPDLDRQRVVSRRWARLQDVPHLVVDHGSLADRVVFGTLDRRLVAGPPNGSVCVVAPTGSGKTANIVVPTMLRWTGPAVVTSVKADVLQLTLARRRERGPVWIFDPTGSTGHRTCRWSPLASVTDYASAMRAAAWLADSSKVDKGGEDQRFWEDLGEQLLAPLLLLAARTGRSMTHVTRWVLHRDEDEVTRLLREELDDPDATAYWNGVCSNVDRTKSSIFLTAQRILSPFAHPHVRDSLDVTDSGTEDPYVPYVPPSETASENDGRGEVFDPGALLNSKGTLYIVAPASDHALFTPVFETLVNAIVREVEHRSASSGGLPIDPRLLLMLDEAANCAPLRRLPNIASSGRGQGLVVVSVWQDLAQVDSIYGASGAATVRSNHEAWCYLPGIKDDRTLEYISKLVGPDEFQRRSDSVDGSGRVSRSYSTTTAEVAPISWLRQMDAGTMLVIVGREKPMRITARGWYDDRDLRALIPTDVAAAFDAALAMPTRSRRRRRKALRS